MRFESNSDMQIPSILVAADTHNIGNRNESFLDSAESAVSSVGKFVATTMVSGANEVYNILPTIGNVFGGEFQQSKTADVLADIDSNLATYYKQNQEVIDVAGFVVGSIVPGMAGTRLLNAGQAALRGAIESKRIGGGIAKAASLLAPSQPKLVAEAVRAAVSPSASFSVWGPQSLKAVAGSLTQNTLEGLAATAAVEATMFKSPVLADHDVGDIASNIMWGGIVSGAVGTLFGAAKVSHTIYKEMRDVSKEMAPVTVRATLHETAPASSKIITYMDDLAITTGQTPAADTKYASKFENLKETKLRNIETDIRTEYLRMSGADTGIADTWYNMHKVLPAQQTEATLFGTVESGRIGFKSEVETKLAAIARKGLNATADETAYANAFKVQYVKNYGTGMGNVVDEIPRLLNIADTLNPSSSFKDAVASYKQGLKTAWDPATSSHLQAEARYITAMKTTLKGDESIGARDLPYLTAALEQGMYTVKVEGASFKNLDELRSFVLQQKDAVALELATAKKLALTDPEIAKIVDSTSEWLNGTRLADDVNAFALRHAADTYNAALKTEKFIPTWELPSYTKVVKDITPVLDVDGMVLQGMAAIKTQQRVYAEQNQVIADSILGQDAVFPDILDRDLLKATPEGPGGGLLTSQNANYGALGSKTQYTGVQTLKVARAEEERFKTLAAPVLYNVANKQEAAIEFSMLNNRLRSIPENYVLDELTGQLKLAKIVDYEAAVAAGQKVTRPNIAVDIPETIAFENAEALEMARLHIKENSGNVEKLSAIRSQQGLKFERDPRIFYPIPPNPRDYKFYAFVVDDSIQGSFGKSKMLHATSAQDLEAKMTQVKSANPDLRVLTGKDAEAYYKSIGQFEYERTLTDLDFNAAKRTGASAEYLPATDPKKIVEDFQSWHVARKYNLVREAVSLKYEPQIRTLLKLGDDYTKVSRSHYTSMDALSYVENAVKNPYHDYVKSMLGVSTKSDFPYWTPLNDLIDRKVSGLFNSVYETFNGIKSPQELDKINALMQRYGYQGAAYDALTAQLANSGVARDVATNFVRRANAMLGTVMLRLDPINALNNVIGSNVLLGTEAKSVIRAIREGNTDAAGELAQLAHIGVPGTEDAMFSAGKLISNSMKRFHSDEGKALREVYKQRGYITQISDQYLETVSGLALKGTENAADLESKIHTTFAKLKAAANKGEALTGNKVAEEFNRFVAADVMKQITDVGVKHGVITEKEAWAYINTFVNRTQGNYVAAQRPGMFSGPVGQAMGLFQTYQFNFLQQLLRHVGEGSVKDSITLAGLQGGIYGLNGLPAFNAINTHIIGTMSGNIQHKDMYDFTYGAAGVTAGNWLMYGAGSNVWGLIHPDLSLNLYTRGDINPRHLTVVPTNPADIPFVQASSKLFGSLKDTYSKISMGGDVWGSLLQGIEHSGINRPLAGLAQSLEAFGNPYMRAYSTSSKGNVIASNDLLTISSLVRLSGAKPLDEARITDRAFTVDVYRRKDSEARKQLGEAIKTTVIAGKNPSTEQVEEFAAQYAKLGGKQSEFNQFMLQQYKHANTSQANELKSGLSSKFSQSMQRVMNYDLADFQ